MSSAVMVAFYYKVEKIMSDMKNKTTSNILAMRKKYVVNIYLLCEG